MFRVEHFGELAPECIKAYYRYGSTLLGKAQAEADPLGNNMPKKEAHQESSGKDIANGEESVVSSDYPEKQESSSGGHEGTQILRLVSHLYIDLCLHLHSH